MDKRGIIFLLTVICLSNLASAATIRGTVYDLELEQVQNAIIEISSVPKQTFVAKSGTFLFNLPPGNYTVTAYIVQDGIRYSAINNLVIIKEGEYFSDMILIPEITEEQQLFDEEVFTDDINIKDEKGSNFGIAMLIVVVTLILLAVYLVLRNKKRRKAKPIDTDMVDEVFDFIKKNDGRTTQKEIRKSFPVSEAKISRVVSQLESQGKIKKIKKGRGNLIFLNERP